MCGICGVLDYNSDNAIDNITLKQMCDAMRHRGPDDEGIYISPQSKPSVKLGHRRLKIIDLSQSGHQPMSNENGRIWIVFNGEIYNYKELRVELENKGHIFKSHTDTETVIHLYEEYGEDCVRFLRGMFVFAIWDEDKKMLLLARDRVGKKPLLYYHQNNKFCFASEFTAILASNLINKQIRPEAIDYYLTFGYIPAPLTIYRNVFKLLPAHILMLKDNKLTIRKYWELDYSHKIKISEQEAEEEVLKLLKDAVRVRLYSDVPVGAFLSGGIDSSAVVALMSQFLDRKVKTFSIGFTENEYSELKYARTIAKRFATEHREFMVKPRAMEILPLLVERYGEPYADSSCIPTYYVSRETRQFVTVALNGDGGDELFAGYERYQAMLLAEYYSRTPNFLKDILGGFAGMLPNLGDPKNKLNRLKRFFKAANLFSRQRYMKWTSIFDEDLKESIYSDAFSKELFAIAPLKFMENFFDNSNSLDMLDTLLRLDTNTYLPNDLLVKVDIASMANSLEARSPFLDHKLMEFVACLPSGYKMKGLIKKYILKKALVDFIPQANLWRKKMGFGVPLNAWFRNELRDFLNQTLLSDKSLKRGYFKPEHIKRMVQSHAAGRRDYSYQLWALLMLELWHERFID